MRWFNKLKTLWKKPTNREPLHMLMTKAAEEMGRSAHPAARRALQEGDILYLSRAPRERHPINLLEWVEGCWGNQPPACKPVLEVIGEHDVVRRSAETGQLIYHDWARGYVFNPALRGAELIVFSTEDAWVFSTHESDDTAKKRILACLAEAIAISRDMLPNKRPAEEQVKKLTQSAQSLWGILPEDARRTLHNRYYDAPILLRWPAPDWENNLARALVRCALAGGKKAGQEWRELPQNTAVPAWRNNDTT